MFIALIILTRILFIASMVFIIGYVFGNFSKSVALTRITRVATVLAIVLFIGSNIGFWRSGGGWRHGGGQARYECNYNQADSLDKR